MILGLDIGGTKMEAAVFDEQFTALARHRVATPTDDYSGFMAEIAGLVAWGDAQAGCRTRVGVGFPGLIDAQGRSLSANVPCARLRHVEIDIAQRLDRPVALCNDTHCFALSEAVGGAGAGFRSVFGAILGTGAAGGLVIDGKLYRGRLQMAGEYGHLPLPAHIARAFDLPFRRCGCGLQNCLEAYIAGPGLLRLARDFGVTAARTADVIAAWQRGDALALVVRECYFALLGAAFVALVKLYDPDIVVLGGGLSLVDEIIEQLPRAIEAELFAGFSAPPVRRAAFGDSSGARGAAILAGQELPL
ncbi:ROK family protein [uncultured Sphingomonas sp.]|uniref:ROK family protein n=1 Tax=uncultured Sphingomonas sp. TaxID=158754 RepID=UPI0025E22C11|nr:ROK family protein [uncultured Sphingomonas sp.]